MRKFDFVLFDLDGTLLNTLGDLQASMNVLLAKYNKPLRTIDEIRRFVGNGILKTVERSFPADTNPKEYQHLYEEFNAYYQKHCDERTAPYEGVLEMMKIVKEAGIRMAVVTNKEEKAATILIRKHFGNLPDIIVGERTGIPTKPHPAMVTRAIKELGANPMRTVYVGDSEVDVLTAKNGNLPCYSVLWGFRDKEMLIENGANTFFETPEELAKALIEEE